LPIRLNPASFLKTTLNSLTKQREKGPGVPPKRSLLSRQIEKDALGDVKDADRPLWPKTKKKPSFKTHRGEPKRTKDTEEFKNFSKKLKKERFFLKFLKPWILPHGNSPKVLSPLKGTRRLVLFAKNPWKNLCPTKNPYISSL
jgi:hypothetical protein